MTPAERAAVIEEVKTEVSLEFWKGPRQLTLYELLQVLDRMKTAESKPPKK